MRLSVLPFQQKAGVTREKTARNVMHGSAENTARREYAAVAQSVVSLTF